MDGYSVHDAATVLGVPEARVWELIARGVLAGTPEADGGMRVFLKANESAKTDAARREPPADPPRTNGNGSQHSDAAPELSPFRELLTEFRSLTERYGQALLALGEARGEVAGLRTRVELLEARLDLRLPGPRPVSTAAWEMPDHVGRPGPDSAATEAADQTVPPPAVEPARPAAADEEQLVEPADVPVPEVAPRRRGATRQRITGGRIALGGFAEALARAQDPTLESLPGAREAAEALAELQRDAAEPALEAAAREEGQPDDFAEPPAVAAAIPLADLVDEGAGPGLEAGEEPAPVGEALAEETAAAPAEASSPPSPYSTEVVEPDWFAEGDFTWLDAAQQVAQPSEAAPDPAASAEPDATSEPDTAVEPAVAVEPQPDLPEPEAEHAELHAQAASPAEAIQDAFEAEPEPEPQESAPAPEGLAAPDFITAELPDEEWWPQQDGPAPWLPVEAEGSASAEPPTATAPAAERPTEEELMWLGDEFEEAGLEFATPGWRSEPEAGTRPAAQADQPDEKPPVLELSDAELAQLASDEGWDMAEVSAIRTFLGRAEPPSAEEDPPSAEEPPAAAGPPPIADAATTDAPAGQATAPAPEAPGFLTEPPPPPPPRAPGQSRIPIDVEEELDARARLDRLTQPPRAALSIGAPPTQAAEGQESEAAGGDAGSDGEDPDTEDPDQAGQSPAAPVPPAARAPGDFRDGNQGLAPRQPGQVDPVWLRGRRGPAATVYRRLRRLFPG